MSNNIVLTADKPVSGGGGCLEGGPRPRPAAKEEQPGHTTSRTPIIIPIKGNNNKMTLSTAEIPLPSNSDIPLPEAGDIPLPSTDMVNIPLPSGTVPSSKHEDIPLPSNESIPLPAERHAAPQTERRRIKVSLSHLEPKGDELLCRSCVMKFTKQIDYDTHLQSEAHQQAIKQSDIQSHGASLLTKRLDKSPSHDNKSGHVSFSFKKNYGSRIVNTQPFIPVRREERRASPVEIKLLKPESEEKTEDVVDGATEKIENGNQTESVESSEREESKSEREDEKDPENKLLMFDFVKVQSKDDTGRVLDWPKEMIMYTKTEPKLMFSCNPLSFDFSQLFSTKKRSVSSAGQGTSIETAEKDSQQKVAVENVQKAEDLQKADSEKRKSHKKKKKKHKHKKHKDKSEVKETENNENTKVGEETGSSSKKKKRKHKRKHEDKENDASKENVENSETVDDKEKKKHKKSKKKSKQSEDEGEKLGEDERKHKKKKKKKSKKRKKKHHGDNENEKSDGEKENKEKEKGDSGESGKESDSEKKDKDSKKKKKKRKKHRRKESGNNDSSESETEKAETVKTEAADKTDVAAPVKRKFPEADSDGESDKIVAKLQALSRTKTVQKPTVVNNQALQKKIKKEPVDNVEKKTPSDRKRVNSESSVNESTPVKKTKVTPKASGMKDHIQIAAVAQTANLKVEKEESWSKIETQTNDNVKSKWDTSDSDMDNALDDTLKKEKVLKKRASARGGVNKTNILKDLRSPTAKSGAKTDNEHKKIVNQSSSQRSNKSNLSAGSAKLLNTINDKPVRKSRRVSRSPASSHSRSRSRTHSRHRSYSRSGSSSCSRSRSYSSSSYYSDDSRHSRHRRGRRSSSRSYSRSSSRSRSRSYRRRRGRSSSYSDYSRSRSYSTSRSRSRSHRRRKRSYTRSRSRSYSTSSYSSRSRSRTRSYRKSRRKNRRKKTLSKDRSLSVPPAEKDIVTKKKTEKEDKEKVKEVKEKVDPSEIPLPDLSGKKDDERTEEKLQKLKEKKRRTDVGETVAKLVESLPADIPLPFSEGASKTVSSDSLPSGPPTEAPKETDSGFIGPKMPGPPPPPPNMGQRFPPNHGPPGPPRPGYMHGQWDHWDAPGPWDSPGPWDGHRPPFRGMRPPYDPRMYGPYDPRRRGPPPHYMNRPRGPPPYMGPRYPGPPGHHPDYGYDYGEYDYTEDDTPKSSSPPPLPKDPPKESSPKPPLPKKKGKDQTEPEQNPDIVIPPEQAEQYKHLQKQAAKHARRQLRRQAKKELGEPDEDSTSSESEPEEQPEEVVEEAVVDETQPQLVAVPQQVVLQPQPAGSPSGAYILVSGGQQYIVQKPQFVQAGVPIQAGQPVVAASQGAIMATAAAAAAGAHPAHIVQQVPVGPQLLAAPAQLSAGVPVHMASAASIQHFQQVQQLQQLQQIQQIQQIQQAQAIQAHNQAMAAAAVQQGPIVFGNRILVPTLGVRPGI
ncbi:serine/arginine repetitive matrix protein 2-like [Mercenaria mercenaria]|uniref:serine/arginine repetitive matrix protein 2-like n=1 Tax=Mercenaria mercenaria TaxID=6596 RepID=UPI00234F440D|nr:serine/arginine repetitive matrix protein 2-like [Mercenaria mercenaria]